jgi:hypothetical protein
MQGEEDTAALGCRQCGFVLRPRAPFLTMKYCPRCLARRRVLEPLVAVDGSRVAVRAEP